MNIPKLSETTKVPLVHLNPCVAELFAPIFRRLKLELLAISCYKQRKMFLFIKNRHMEN